MSVFPFQQIPYKKLYKYFGKYKQVDFRGFYFGADKHPKSKKFIKQMRQVGYKVKTKPVKYIKIGRVGDNIIRKRKCDFDIEICMDVYKGLEKGYEGFVFLTGDGDFVPLYKYLIKKKKQVIVVYARKHVGREVWQVKEGLFKVQLDHLGV